MKYVRNRYHTYCADNAVDFLSWLRTDERFRPHNPFEAHLVGRNGWIFRGQSNSELSLLPNAHRGNGRRLADFTSQTVGLLRPPKEVGARRQMLGFQLQAELRAIDLFLEMPDKLGLETPIDYSIRNSHTDLINSALAKEDHDYAEIFPLPTLIPGMALAQHHGVPTRLLDWSEEPLVAAFFAAYGASRLANAGKRPTGRRIAVFALHTRGGFDDEIQVGRAPRHPNVFLRAQGGVFTYGRQANLFLLENGRWPKMDDLNENIFRVSLPASESDAVLRELFQYNVTPHHVWPTLSSAVESFSYRKKLFPLS